MPAQQIHPASIVDGVIVPDETVTVDGYQLTSAPGDGAGLAAWADLPAYRIDTGAVMLVDQGAAVGPIELGDYAVRRDGQLRHEPFDGFWNRYVPATAGEA